MRLSDNFIPLLTYARLALKGTPEAYAPFRARIDAMIQEARENSRRAGRADWEIYEAMFAVCAYLDESVMVSGWPGADDWRRQLLQKEHFNTTRAGVEFFSHLEGLTGEHDQVREVYVLCLALGFRGQYAQSGGLRALAELKATHLRYLVGDSSEAIEAGGALFPEAYPAPATEDAPRSRWRLSRREWAVICVPPLVVAALYLSFSLTISELVTNFAALLNQ